MTSGYTARFALAVLCALAPRSEAAEPLVGQAEAAYLIGTVETSGCAFYRNGARYDAGGAAAHMRAKYALIRASSAITTGAAFIEKVATRSAFTGLAYEVEWPGRARLGLAVWLAEALFRDHANGAPRE